MIQVFLAMLILCLVPRFCAHAFAEGPEKNSCKNADRSKIEIGFHCKTSNGHDWLLAYKGPNRAEVWKDMQTGLHWSDKLSQRIRRKAAGDLCKTRIPDENYYSYRHLSRLPTLQDFELAEKHQFREVLPNMADHYYWIDSSVPGAKNIGHMFNGNIGKPEIVVYRSINFENIRCVGLADPMPLGTDMKQK